MVTERVEIREPALSAAFGGERGFEYFLLDDAERWARERELELRKRRCVRARVLTDGEPLWFWVGDRWTRRGALRLARGFYEARR